VGTVLLLKFDVVCGQHLGVVYRVGVYAGLVHKYAVPWTL